MAWSDFFRDDFNGAAGTTASGWVPGTDLPGRKWYVSAGATGVSDDAAQASLTGSGAANLPGPAPDNASWWSAVRLVPDLALSRTGVESAGAFKWYPYSTSPKSSACEIQLVVQALTPAQIAAGMSVKCGVGIWMTFCDPSAGLDFNNWAGYVSVGGIVEITRSPGGANDISISCQADNTNDGLSGGTWTGTYASGTSGTITATLRAEYASGVLKMFHEGAQVLSLTLTSPVTMPAAYRLVSAEFGVGGMVTDSNTLYEQDSLQANYVLVQADSTEVAAFVPVGGGATDVSVSGTSLTVAASLVAGAATATASATGAGAALVATASVLGGAVSVGDVSAPGVALTATAVLSPGVAVGLRYAPDGNTLIYDEFVGALDSAPTSSVDGMTWGAKGTMDAGTVDTGYFDNAVGALKKAVFFSGVKQFPLKYDFDTAVAGVTQVVPASPRSVPGFAMTMNVTPYRGYRARSDMTERCVAQMFFAVETADGLKMMRCAVSGVGTSAISAGADQYCEVVLAETNPNFGMYSPERVVPATFNGQAPNVFRVVVEGQSVSAYLNGVMVTGVRLPSPVVALHSFGFDVTSYNRVNYALVEAPALRPRAWATPRGVYECA